MKLIGEKVTHKSFGRGTITEFAQDCVLVLFDVDSQEKRFSYPSAFGSFLKLDNEILSEQIKGENMQDIAAKAKKAEEYHQKIELTYQANQDEALRLKKAKAKSPAKKTKAK